MYGKHFSDAVNTHDYDGFDYRSIAWVVNINTCAIQLATFYTPKTLRDEQLSFYNESIKRHYMAVRPAIGNTGRTVLDTFCILTHHQVRNTHIYPEIGAAISGRHKIPTTP